MNSIKTYLNSLTAVLSDISIEQIDAVVEVFWDCYQRGGRLVFCGNGGSATTASHLVADFQKNVYLDGGRAWEVLSLTDSTPLMTAWSNDTDYCNVFAGQARCWLRPGDLLVAISGSGNSPNVLAAAETANDIGAISIGLCGYGGGRLADIVHHAVVLESRNMQQVEDVHLVIGHMVYTAMRERLLGARAEGFAR